MSNSLQQLLRKSISTLPQTNRRTFLFGAAAATALASSHTAAFGALEPDVGGGVLKIEAVELFVLHGRYTEAAGVNGQSQVNPEDIYDDLRKPVYMDKPDGTKDVHTSAIYMRIKTSGGIEGLYGPFEKSAALIVQSELAHFLIGKDALAGETLWDQMYRSNRQSRDGIFMMAISAVDNTLWDIRGKYYGVPVYRLLGGPSRESVEMYCSCLGSSLELDKVRKRCVEVKNMGFKHQKWFIGYGPGSGAEGMRKNVELVKVLRETLGDDYDLMFDSFSGWDQAYALEWAHKVEQYHPRWMEEITHPEKIDSFAAVHRGTTIPVASGEHFYGRWEVERYLQANALSVVQADPEWCGGISELLKIGTVCSLHDIPLIPHGHSLPAAIHTIASQSPMTFPMGEYLILKMKHYYHFQTNPLIPENGQIALPSGPGFNVILDPAKIESQTSLTI